MSARPEVGFVIWLTGLPASGKSTLARALSQLLAAQGLPVQVLDSDALRHQLTPQPTYSAAERDWFYDTAVFLADLLARNGVNVLLAATGSRQAYRAAARSRLSRFAEVYLECPPDICRSRDPKGLWRRADAGEIASLPGAGVDYEPPAAPEVHVHTDRLPVETAAAHVFGQLQARGFFR